MKTIQVTPYITQLTWLGLFNAFLVREADGFTLVDTMIGGAAERIMDCARRLKTPIVRIAITHAHSDHVGSLSGLAAKLPGAQRFISTREARFLAGDWSLDPSEPPTKLRVKFPRIPIPMEGFNEGDRIGSLRVVATPGHTPGHACFVDVRDNMLVAGDVYSTFNGVATAARIYLGFSPPWSVHLESGISPRVRPKTANASALTSFDGTRRSGIISWSKNDGGYS